MIYLNVIANIIIALAVAGFIVMLQVPSNPLVKESFIIRFWIKVSLAFTAGGALFNVLTFSNPPISEVALNVGLAGIFSWAYFWHLKLFKEKTKNI